MDPDLFELWSGVHFNITRRSLDSRSDSMSNAVIAELMLENDVQYRTGTLIVVAFNIAAAGFVVFLIVLDTRRALRNRLETLSVRHYLSRIRPAEAFPLALSAAIIAQGIIFATVQSFGLKSLWTNNCELISEVIFPSIWIFGFNLMIMAAETVYRGFKRTRFSKRGRWNMIICGLAVLVASVLSWMPTIVRKRTDAVCMADFIMFAAHWADVGLGINIALITGYCMLGSILAVQLTRASQLERDERIAASRVVYYLAVGVVLMGLLLPFWVGVTFFGDPSVTWMMATVALNLPGFLHCFLHLLLRANADASCIGLAESSSFRCRNWRFFSSTGLDMGQHLATPIIVRKETSRREQPASGKGKTVRFRTPSPSEESNCSRSSSLIRQTAEKSEVLPPPPLQISNRRASQSIGSPGPSIFSNQSNNPSDVVESHPMGFLNDSLEHLLLPPRAPFMTAHDRKSSTVSSATVQIGLRISNVQEYTSTIESASTHPADPQSGVDVECRAVKDGHTNYPSPSPLRNVRAISPAFPPPRDRSLRNPVSLSSVTSEPEAGSSTQETDIICDDILTLPKKTYSPSQSAGDWI